jgi:microcystin degradation protein MlrC
VHFRAAFGPIAARIVVARAPGPMPADAAGLRLDQGIAEVP